MVSWSTVLAFGLPLPPPLQALGRKVREFNAGVAAEVQLGEAELAPGGEQGEGAG